MKILIIYINIYIILYIVYLILLSLKIYKNEMIK